MIEILIKVSGNVFRLWVRLSFLDEIYILGILNDD